MMRKKEINDLINAPRTYEREMKLRAYQNKFIEKSGVSRRLFDCLFVRCSKRKLESIERRLDLMDKKNG